MRDNAHLILLAGVPKVLAEPEPIKVNNIDTLMGIGRKPGLPIDGHYEQTADINFRYSGRYPEIRDFKGTYDGKYHLNPAKLPPENSCNIP